MPNQCVDRKTRKASAAVADKSRVGECTPGTSPLRLAMTRNIQSVAINGMMCRTCCGATVATAFSMIETIPSRAVWTGPGSIFSRRVSNHAHSQIRAIIIQVVSIVLLTVTGPSLAMDPMDKSPSVKVYSRINKYTFIVPITMPVRIRLIVQRIE